MSAERGWDLVWRSVWLVVLTGLSVGLFPHWTTFQLWLVPLWVVYDLVTRGVRTGCWLAIWGGVLLEGVWYVPMGACVSFFLLVWWGLTHFRERLPLMQSPALYGSVLGVWLVPLLRFWLTVYAVPFYGWSAVWLLPSFGQFCWGILVGLVGGALVFALANAMEFHVLRPKREERLSDEG